jgi:PAS domain S-box-containing protein
MTRVLIVDDLAENLYLLRALLTGHGCRVVEARNGEEALATAHRDPPDLIVSDLMMPVMDGFTLLRHWKADPQLRGVPFVVYTATYTEPEDEQLALELGADAFIVKPAEPDAFMARLNEVLSQAQSGSLAARQPAAPAAAQLERYNQVLVSKIAAKRLDLEAANRALASREASYRQMFQSNPHPMWVYDIESLRFLAVNDAAVAHYGYTQDEFLAMSIADIRPPADVPALLAAVAAVPVGFSPAKVFRHHRKDGSTIQVEISSHTINFEGHRAKLVLARDITARRLAEERVRYLNRVYSVLSDINQAIVREDDLQALLDNACRIAVEKGLFRLAWIGLLDADPGQLRVRAHSGADTATLEILTRLIQAESPAGCEFTRQALGGHTGVCNDIAGDPRAAGWRVAALARGYGSMAAFPLTTADGVIGAFNLYAAEPDFFNHEESSLLTELAADVSFAMEVARREQERRDTESRVAAQRSALIALTNRGTLDLPDVAIELRRIAEVASRTLNVARVSIWQFGQSRSSIECSDLFELGAERHSSGQTLSSTTHPGYFRALLENDVIAADNAPAHPSTSEFADDYLRPLGISSMLDVPIAIRGERAGVLCHEHVGAARQWTEDEKTFAVAMANLVSLALEAGERRKVEEQLRQSQKMEGIGQLAGGVAHDFNNILGAIILQLELTAMSDDLAAEVREGMAEAVAAAKRAADLTRQLLLFSRRQVMQPRDLDLNESITSLAKMLRRVIGEDVQLQLHLHPEPLATRADPGMLDQVLLNLAVNARDAMPEGGRLRKGGLRRGRRGPASRSPTRPVCAADRLRHRGGRPTRDRAANLRALFHHQGSRQGHGAGAGHGVRHRAAASGLDRAG